MSSRRRGVICIGKHVCGNATDVTLVGMKNLLRDSISEGAAEWKYIEGICIATCCHSSCVQDSCVGLSWLQDVCSVSNAEFELMRKWSGYFTLSGDTSSVGECTVVPESSADVGIMDKDSALYHAMLGRMCKRLIDHGRVQYIRRELGLEATLIPFVHPSVTPENVLLVAWRKKHADELALSS